MIKFSHRPAWIRAGALGISLWVAAVDLHGQNYQQVAPSQPTAKPGGQIVNELPEAEKKRRAEASEAVALSKLKGVVFVSSAKEVQPDGVKSGQPIAPGDVAFAKNPDFAPVITPFLDQPVSMASLDKMTSAVVDYYRAHDRPIVNVFVPKQNITSGYIQIVVVEGRVGEVRGTGAQWFSNDDLKSELRLHPGDPISGDMLRDNLNWVNRNPFHQSDILFGPGNEPGLTDVTMKSTDRFPFRAFAGMNDTGNALTGDNRYYTGFNYGDLFGLGQQFSYQYTTAEDSNEFIAHAASWTIPLPWHHLLTIYGSYGDANANVPGTGGNVVSGGENWQTSLRYEVPLRGATNFTHSIVAGFDFKRSNNNLAFGGDTISDVYADTDQFVLAYQAAYTDPYGTTSGNLTGYYSPGGFTQNDNPAAYQAMRYDADDSYVYGQLNLERVTNLPWGFTSTERGLLQVSDANLLPSEQIGLGGSDTVRGYDEREANGDSGFLISSEIETPAISLGTLVGFKNAYDRFQLLGFVDYGGTSLHHQGPSDTNPNTNLLGVGPGIRYAITPYMDFRFDYGFQLIHTGFNDRNDSRMHFGLTFALPGNLDERPTHVVKEAKDAKDVATSAVEPGFMDQFDYDAGATGFNTSIYGGVTALQDGSATLTASNAPTTVNPNSLTANQQSEVGGVGGIRTGYTFKNFTDDVPWLMPAIDVDAFWAGYKYKTEAEATPYTGSYLSTDLNTYSLMVEPKVKMNLGKFRPYLGVGVGGAYIHADNSHVNLQSTLAGLGSENTGYSKSLDAGAVALEGLAGVEYFLARNWSISFDYKFEYLDADGNIHSSVPSTSPPVHLNYHFDGLGSQFFLGGLSYYY